LVTSEVTSVEMKTPTVSFNAMFVRVRMSKE